MASCDREGRVKSLERPAWRAGPGSPFASNVDSAPPPSRRHDDEGADRSCPLRRQPARQAEAHALAHLSPPCRQLEEIEREAARLFHVQAARVLGPFAELGASVP